jgi:hypothetical protein
MPQIHLFCPALAIHGNVQIQEDNLVIIIQFPSTGILAKNTLK